MKINVGSEELVWVIVAIFWGIAKIVSAAAKKKRSERPHTDASSDTSNDPIAEQLRKLLGGQDIQVSESTYREIPKVPPKNPLESDDVEVLPGMCKSIDPQPAISPEKIPEKVSEFDFRPTMSQFRRGIPSIKLPIMTTTEMPNAIQRRKKTKSSLAQLIDPANRKSIRRAMLSHILFSPPKAME